MEHSTGGNREYLNTHNHVPRLCNLSNTDLQHILTNRGVAQYDIKYMHKLKHIFGNGVDPIENAMSKMTDSTVGSGSGAYGKDSGMLRRDFLLRSYQMKKWHQK